MKRNLLLLSLITTIFITGCSSASITTYFDKSEFYNRSLQYTKKADIKDDKNGIDAFLNITYLNSIDKKYDNVNENFIVGLYILNDEQKSGFENSNYELSLNSKEAVSIKELSLDDELVQVALKNSWAKYYYVSFKVEKDEDNLTIKLQEKKDSSKTATISFLKEL